MKKVLYLVAIMAVVLLVGCETKKDTFECTSSTTYNDQVITSTVAGEISDGNVKNVTLTMKFPSKEDAKKMWDLLYAPLENTENGKNFKYEDDKIITINYEKEYLGNPNADSVISKDEMISALEADHYTCK